jgi:predicted Zn-dependent peptidase
MTNRMLQEGTRYRSGREIAEQLDFFGAYLQYEAGADRSGVSLYSLHKHLDAVLPVALELLFQPGFPLTELETTVRNNLQQLEVEGQKVSTLARRQFMKSLFGNQHPYGYQTQPDDLKSLRPDQLAGFHKRHYTTDNLQVVVAGWQPERALEALNRALIQLQPCFADKITRAYPVETTAPGKQVVEKAGAVQHALRVGSLMVGKHHPDYPGLKVLNTVLGGYFGSRLMSNLREDKGYTYGVGSAIMSYERGAFFTIATEVGAEVSHAALDEIYKEVNLLREKPIESDELEAVRAYLQGIYLSNFDGAFALADRFKDVHFFGLDYSYYDHYISTVQSIQPDALQALAVKYLRPEEFIAIQAGS